MALIKDEKRPFEVNEDRLLDDIPVLAAAILFEGSAVGENVSTGFARALVSGDTFLGFAVAGADATGLASGVLDVRVQKKGALRLAVAATTVANLGDTVDATDDGTFVVGGGGSPIGKITRFISAGLCIVRFEATAVRSL